jgi:hypothetical protein
MISFFISIIPGTLQNVVPILNLLLQSFLKRTSSCLTLLLCAPFNPFQLIINLQAEGKHEEIKVLLQNISKFLESSILDKDLKFSEVQALALREFDWILTPTTLINYCNTMIKLITRESQEMAINVCKGLNILNDVDITYVFIPISNDVVIPSLHDTACFLRIPSVQKLPEPPLPEYPESWSEFLLDNWIIISIGTVVIVSLGIGFYYWFKKPLAIDNPPLEELIDNSSSLEPLAQGTTKLYSYYESEIYPFCFFLNILIILIFIILYNSNYLLFFYNKHIHKL